MQIIYKVDATPSLRVRASPSIGAKQIGSLSPGTQVTVTKLEKNESDGYTWGQHSTGWSSISSPNGTIFMSVVSSAPATQTTVVPTKTNPITPKPVTKPATKSTTYNILSNTSFALQNARSIIGLPAQFMDVTDPRIPGSTFGRSYTESILMDMPLCTIIPGGPRFLNGRSKETKEGVLQALKDLASGTYTSGTTPLTDIVDTLLGGTNSRYYEFETQFTEYIQYVNSLNRITSYYLGISEVKGINDIPYKDLNWKTIFTNENVHGLGNIIGNVGAISLYFDKSGTSASEGASNATDKSALDGLLQQVSSQAKEAAFITNSFAGKDFFGSANENMDKINTYSMDIATSSNMVQQIISNLKAGITTVASGSNLLLPEIWRDSSFSRTYTLDFHFATPYGTPEAFFLNVAAPMNFVLPLVLPRQFGANGYGSPFLIQAFAQGIFNSSLGIVDSLSITKFGSGDAVSRDHLPLEIKMSLSFKDLYSALSLSLASNENLPLFVNNIELMDYIATLSGINLNEPDIHRKLKMFIDSKLNTIRDAPGNIMSKIYDILRSDLMRYLKY